MGPIQSAMNQAVQTGAGAATMAKHFVDQGKRDAMDAVQRTEALANENKTVSKELKETHLKQTAAGEANEKAIKASVEASRQEMEYEKSINEFRANKHPQNEKGQFMSRSDKAKKLLEMRAQHRTLQHNADIASQVANDSIGEYVALTEQKGSLQERYDYLQQKKQLTMDMLPGGKTSQGVAKFVSKVSKGKVNNWGLSNTQKALDTQFESAGKQGTTLGEAAYYTSTHGSNKGENK